MAQKTKIGWTDCTSNPIVGCTPVSDGCKNCYALRMARRLKGTGLLRYQGVVGCNGHWNGRIAIVPTELHLRLHHQMSFLLSLEPFSKICLQLRAFYLSRERMIRPLVSGHEDPVKVGIHNLLHNAQSWVLC